MKIGRMAGASALAVALTCALPGCGSDDDNPSEDASTEDGGAQEEGGTEQDAGAEEDAGEDGDEDAGTDEDAGEDEDASTDEDAGEDEDASVEPTLPELPTALGLGGCEQVGIGPICTVSQTEDTFTANCSGTEYTGTVDTDNVVTLTRADETDDETGEVSSLSCDAELVMGRLRGTCTETTTPTEGEATEVMCDMSSAAELRPGISCMQLPTELTDVVLCAEGDDMGGSTVDVGDCSIVQYDCDFQASCEGGLVLTGSANMDGISFNQELVALADAGIREEGDTPSFLAGESVSHSCSGIIDGTTLTGECGAGRAGRGPSAVPNTSVCSVSGGASAVPVCDPVGPESTLFVLDSCDILEQGEGGAGGIGEPVCAFRQNNCVWDVQCGRSPLTKFSGMLEPGDTKVEWTLATGTPCEFGFDDEGNGSGKCSVPGQEACLLDTKDAVAGGPGCDAIFTTTDISARGCGSGGGTALLCSAVMQHGCNFMGICDFSYLPDQVMAGSITRDDEGLQTMAFSSFGDWQCSVTEPTEAQIDVDRFANEWVGQCMTPAGGLCRESVDEFGAPSYDHATGSGFRGLQVFVGQDPATFSDFWSAPR